MAKAKIGELDIVRGLAILAVVVIHSTSDGSSYELMGRSHTQLLYFFINKMCAFAVPLFILVSGLVLFYVYIDNWSAAKAGQFYLKRVRSVIVPYLLWSFIYYMYDQWLIQPQHVTLDWADFGSKLPWADAKYHLYFMIIIIQFYLLFPPLVWLSRKFAWFRRLLPLWGLLVQAGFYCYRHWVHPLDHGAELCVSYFLFFTFGGWLGIHYEQARAFIRRHAGWLVPLGIAFGLAYTGMFILDQYRLASFENTWYEAFWTLYGCGSALIFIVFALWLERSWRSLGALLTSLGFASFGVYLMHPLVLTTWKLRIDPPGSALGFNLYNIGAFALTLLVPWIATLAYKQAAGLLRRRPKPSPSRS